jgi:cytochrome P450
MCSNPVAPTNLLWRKTRQGCPRGLGGIIEDSGERRPSMREQLGRQLFLVPVAPPAREEPIFFSPLLNMWVVSRYDDVKAIVNDPRRFSSENALEQVTDYTLETLEILRDAVPFSAVLLVNSNPPRHTRGRAVYRRPKPRLVGDWVTPVRVGSRIGRSKMDHYRMRGYPRRER